MNINQDLINVVKNGDFYKNLLNGTLVMDNTEYSQWNACFMKGFIFGALKRVSTHNQSALIFGEAVHSGLEHFYKHKTSGRQERLLLMRECVRKAVFVADDKGLDSMNDPKRNSMRLEECLVSYFAHLDVVPNEEFHPISPEFVELDFKVPMGTVRCETPIEFGKVINVQWSGKIDLVVNHKGGLWVVDHKTTSVMGPKFVDDKVRSTQMLGYTYALRQMSALLNQPIEGVIINALAARSSGFEFKQFEIPFNDWQIEEFQEEVLVSVKNLVDDFFYSLSTGIIAPNRESCVTKYGQCSMYAACNVHKNIRSKILFDDSFFKDNTWNPNAE